MAIEIVDFPIKKNDLPIKHGVFSSLCSCLPGRVIEGFLNRGREIPINSDFLLQTMLIAKGYRISGISLLYIYIILYIYYIYIPTWCWQPQELQVGKVVSYYPNCSWSITLPCGNSQKDRKVVHHIVSVC